MTTSSSEQLPARSPIPLIVHSICPAPLSTAARLLATARPRSLWQWTLMTALSMFGIDPPHYMQGQALFGPRVEARKLEKPSRAVVAT